MKFYYLPHKQIPEKYNKYIIATYIAVISFISFMAFIVFVSKSI